MLYLIDLVRFRETVESKLKLITSILTVDFSERFC